MSSVNTPISFSWPEWLPKEASECASLIIGEIDKRIDVAQKNMGTVSQSAKEAGFYSVQIKAYTQERQAYNNLCSAQALQSLWEEISSNHKDKSLDLIRCVYDAYDDWAMRPVQSVTKQKNMAMHIAHCLRLAATPVGAGLIVRRMIDKMFITTFPDDVRQAIETYNAACQRTLRGAKTFEQFVNNPSPIGIDDILNQLASSIEANIEEELLADRKSQGFPRKIKAGNAEEIVFQRRVVATMRDIFGKPRYEVASLLLCEIREDFRNSENADTIRKNTLKPDQ